VHLKVNILVSLFVLVVQTACINTRKPEQGNVSYFKAIQLEPNYSWRGLDQITREVFERNGGYKMQYEDAYLSELSYYNEKGSPANFPFTDFHCIEFYHYNDENAYVWEWYFLDEYRDMVEFSPGITSIGFELDYYFRPRIMMNRNEIDYLTSDDHGVAFYYFVTDEAGRPAKVLCYDLDSTLLQFDEGACAIKNRFSKDNKLISRHFMTDDNQFVPFSSLDHITWSYSDTGIPESMKFSPNQSLALDSALLRWPMLFLLPK